MKYDIVITVDDGLRFNTIRGLDAQAALDLWGSIDPRHHPIVQHGDMIIPIPALRDEIEAEKQQLLDEIENMEFKPVEEVNAKSGAYTCSMPPGINIRPGGTEVITPEGSSTMLPNFINVELGTGEVVDVNALIGFYTLHRPK